MIILLWTTCIILGLIVLVMIISMNIYNRIVDRLNSVEQTWVTVVAQEKSKNKNILTLEKAIGQYAINKTSLLKQISDLKLSLIRLEPNKIDLDKLADAEIKTLNLLDSLHVFLEKSPELKALGLFSNLMNDIANYEKGMRATITVFNQNIEHFNNGLDVFPDSIVNNIFSKKPKLKTLKDAKKEVYPNINL